MFVFYREYYFFLYQKHSLFFQFYYNDNKNHIEQFIQGLGNLRIWKKDFNEHSFVNIVWKGI